MLWGKQLIRLDSFTVAVEQYSSHVYGIGFHFLFNLWSYFKHQCPLPCPSVPGQPSKFQVGAVSDTSIELTWEPAYEKEGIINYELRYMDRSLGTQARISPLNFKSQRLRK